MLPFNFIKPFKVSVKDNIRAYADVSLYIFTKALTCEVPLTSVFFLNETSHSLFNYKLNLYINELAQT